MSKVVAVIGASSNRSKFGNKALRAFRKRGYEVVPINPNEAEVEGIKTFASVLDVPGPIDLATLYVPPQVGESFMEAMAAKGIREVWVNPGAGSPGVVESARRFGITPVMHCSIIAIGENPGDY